MPRRVAWGAASGPALPVEPTANTAHAASADVLFRVLRVVCWFGRESWSVVRLDRDVWFGFWLVVGGLWAVCCGFVVPLGRYVGRDVCGEVGGCCG